MFSYEPCAPPSPLLRFPFPMGEKEITSPPKVPLDIVMSFTYNKEVQQLPILALRHRKHGDVCARLLARRLRIHLG